MLSKISWSSFIWVLIMVVIPYYMFVLFAYFRKEIFSVSTGRKIMVNKNKSEGLSGYSNSESVSNLKSDETAESEGNSFTLINELLEDLKIVFNKSAKENTVKEELIQAVRSKLKIYPELKGKDIREDITEHISLEVKDKCNIELLPEDIKFIWAP